VRELLACESIQTHIRGSAGLTALMLAVKGSHEETATALRVHTRERAVRANTERAVRANTERARTESAHTERQRGSENEASAGNAPVLVEGESAAPGK
jgi:hypothetical protein